MHTKHRQKCNSSIVALKKAVYILPSHQYTLNNEIIIQTIGLIIQLIVTKTVSSCVKNFLQFIMQHIETVNCIYNALL
jgi:hypothetical protein